jgi:hypothetical protein
MRVTLFMESWPGEVQSDADQYNEAGRRVPPSPNLWGVWSRVVDIPGAQTERRDQADFVAITLRVMRPVATSGFA